MTMQFDPVHREFQWRSSQGHLTRTLQTEGIDFSVLQMRNGEEHVMTSYSDPGWMLFSRSVVYLKNQNQLPTVDHLNRFYDQFPTRPGRDEETYFYEHIAQSQMAHIEDSRVVVTMETNDINVGRHMGIEYLAFVEDDTFTIARNTQDGDIDVGYVKDDTFHPLYKTKFKRTIMLDTADVQNVMTSIYTFANTKEEFARILHSV